MLSSAGRGGVRSLVFGSGAVSGFAALPNTGGRNWFMITAITTLSIGVAMLCLQAVVAIERRK